MKISLYFNTFFFIFWGLLVSGYSWADNSLVSPSDISEMKKEGINNVVVELIAEEQTCSLTPAMLIKLHHAGADDNLLKKIILGDRYKNPEKSTLMKDQMEFLKTEGVSDNLIEKLFPVPNIRNEVDNHGNEHVIYRSWSRESHDKRDSPSPGNQFHINIEKVEKD